MKYWEGFKVVSCYYLISLFFFPLVLCFPHARIYPLFFVRACLRGRGIHILRSPLIPYALLRSIPCWSSRDDVSALFRRRSLKHPRHGPRFENERNAGARHSVLRPLWAGTRPPEISARRTEALLLGRVPREGMATTKPRQRRRTSHERRRPLGRPRGHSVPTHRQWDSSETRGSKDFVCVSRRGCCSQLSRRQPSVQWCRRQQGRRLSPQPTAPHSSLWRRSRRESPPEPS